MDPQIALDIQPEEPKAFWIHDTNATSFGNFKAFATLLPGIFKGIETRTGEVRYFRQVPIADNWFGYRRIIQY